MGHERGRAEGEARDGSAGEGPRVGLLADVAAMMASGGGRQDGRHAVGYDLSWRSLNDPSLKASPGVETHIGNKLKSAIKYTFQTRTLDDRLFPTRGWSFR